MTRRANGEGSIYQRKSDGTWVEALSLEDGRRRTVYGGTQREVRQKLQDLRAEVEDGITVSAARMTVASYLSTWVEKTLPAKVKAGALKPQTLDSYRYMIELHMAPQLGAVDFVPSSRPMSGVGLPCYRTKNRLLAARNVLSIEPNEECVLVVQNTKMSGCLSCPPDRFPTLTQFCGRRCQTQSTIN
jgi:hypothetical protein